MGFCFKVSRERKGEREREREGEREGEREREILFCGTSYCVCFLGKKGTSFLCI